MVGMCWIDDSGGVIGMLKYIDNFSAKFAEMNLNKYKLLQ